MHWISKNLGWWLHSLPLYLTMGLAGLPLQQASYAVLLSRTKYAWLPKKQNFLSQSSKHFILPQKGRKQMDVHSIIIALFSYNLYKSKKTLKHKVSGSPRYIHQRQLWCFVCPLGTSPHLWKYSLKKIGSIAFPYSKVLENLTLISFYSPFHWGQEELNASEGYRNGGRTFYCSFI